MISATELSPQRQAQIEIRDSRVQALGHADYDAYLASSQWETVRQRFIRSGPAQVCAVCEGGDPRDLELHHTTYERVGQEEITDLAWLCSNCHRLVHALEVRGDLELDFDGLVDPEQAEIYRDQQAKP